MQPDRETDEALSRIRSALTRPPEKLRSCSYQMAVDFKNWAVKAQSALKGKPNQQAVRKLDYELKRFQ